MDTKTLIAHQNDAFRKSLAQFQTVDNVPKGKVARSKFIMIMMLKGQETGTIYIR